MRDRAPTAVLLGAALALAGCPISPVAYEPPEAPPLEGPTAPNDALLATETFELAGSLGAEDVDVDSEGRIYGGTDDGKILRITPGAEPTVETFVDTGGRPLGLHFDAAGNLVVADAVKGLLSVAPDGSITTLATEAGGVPFLFTDDLDVASDGRIYFSDASDTHGVHDYMYDLLEARPHGRLLVHDPSTGTTEVLLDDLYFANGVALSSNEDFVLVNETYRYRITRYWLTGEKGGTSEIFIDNLPGFPDGVSSNGRGTFWVALFTVRNPIADWLHPHPTLKSMMAAMPRFTWPGPKPYGLVLALDEEGRIVRSLHDPEGDVIHPVTSAEEHEGHLYLGTLTGPVLGRLPLEE